MIINFTANTTKLIMNINAWKVALIYTTNEFMAPALKLCATCGLFSRAKYTNLGRTCPSSSTSLALEIFP